ncbi:MAG: hypothetical protein EA360_04680 [Balneolaceae bacterium]|nr:MAG: hypothetical protein EA360_04680 [Balneolaceae bacterium]
MTRRADIHILSLLLVLPFFFYEDLLLAAVLAAAGLFVIYKEKIHNALSDLHWRELIFFIYAFHMLFGERAFAYLGFEPLFLTEIVLTILVFSYAKDLMQIRKILAVYYVLILIGAGFAMVYFIEFRLDAVRDSFMLLYALWVPVVYHVFRDKSHYQLFLLFLKMFIVLKALAYFYEAGMILLGFKRITFEGFRFGVGYILPSLIVVSLFLPFRKIGWQYKLISLVMIPAVFTIFHRSIFFGIILGLLFIFWLGTWVSRRTIVLYGFSSVVLLFAFLVYYNTLVDVDIFRILDQKSSLEEGNINYRFLSWQQVLLKFNEFFLLGYGVGKPVMYAYENIFYSTINLTYFQIRDLGGNAQPHNSYLNILARFGILIFPIFLYALIKPLRVSIDLIRYKNRDGDDFYSLFLLNSGFLMVMYVLAFFNVVLEGPHHSFPFWLAIGMLLSFERAGNFSYRRIRIVHSGRFSKETN